MVRCQHCMHTYNEEYEVCPHCGTYRFKNTKEVYHLKPETILYGKYYIGEVVGFGGFGVVYKAFDMILNQTVAIKEYFPTDKVYRLSNRLSVEIYDSEMKSLFRKEKSEFLKEAQIIAKYSFHPNIAHVFDFFEENGTAYFVMEYLEGHTLKYYIDQGEEKKIDCNIAINITCSVLNALQTVHKDGIIHRDIKPSNVFLLDNGGVKLFDFGAARLSDDERERTRTVVITPGYAPPEQYQTKSKQGAFTDIYATGAMLYHMLSGEKPLESINRKIEDTVIPPCEKCENIPQYVSDAVMRAMALQPEIRFKDVKSFADALQGERKYRTAKDEVKYRNTRRNLIISMLTILILTLVIGCIHLFSEKKKDAMLANTSLSVWIPVSSDPNEGNDEELYQSMFESFTSLYPQVSVEVTAIESDEYADRLLQSLEGGYGPDVFDSSCLSINDFAELADVTRFFSYTDFLSGKYMFLDNYDLYFSEGKQIPLSFDVPIRYTNMGKDNLSDGTDYQDYIDEKANYIGLVNEYSQVQEDMAGLYAVSETDITDKDLLFGNLWSINADSNHDKQNAGFRLIYCLLSEASQNTLCIEYTNGLPINRSIFTSYIEINNDFSFLEKVLNEFTIIQE